MVKLFKWFMKLFQEEAEKKVDGILTVGDVWIWRVEKDHPWKEGNVWTAKIIDLKEGWVKYKLKETGEMKYLKHYVFISAYKEKVI
jgi:hypothetical protein